MRDPRLDWEEVAMSRLIRVLGERPGREMAAAVKKELGLSSLRSAAELRAFAERLQSRGGFAAAVGGLLQLHATMHDDGSVTP